MIEAGGEITGIARPSSNQNGVKLVPTTVKNREQMPFANAYIKRSATLYAHATGQPSGRYSRRQ
jgi:hypothetical protein